MVFVCHRSRRTRCRRIPIISILTGGLNFTDLKYVITPKHGDIAENAIAYGSFIQNVVNFFIMAFVIFLMVKFVNKLRKPAPVEKPAEPAPTKEEVLLSEIRDILKNK